MLLIQQPPNGNALKRSTLHLGTTGSLHGPSIYDAAQCPGGSETPIAEQPQSHHGHIIIIDDNLASLKLLEEMLVQRGHEVRSFQLSRLALASAAKNPPDLILLDINMPEMNGYELCQRLKSVEELSGIPIIFASLGEFVGDWKLQRGSLRNRRNFRQVESNDFC